MICLVSTYTAVSHRFIAAFRVGDRFAGIMLRCKLSSLLVGLSLTLTAPFVLAANADNAQEYRLKAAFIYNFSQFIEWPANSFPQPDSPFTICVVGDDPFGDALLALQKRSYQGHPIVVNYPKTAAEAHQLPHPVCR